MSYDVVEAQTLWDYVMSMRRDYRFQAALMDSLIELRVQPFKKPRLQTHDVGTGSNGKTIFSSDVGGPKSDRRLVWQLFNRTLVALLYGSHAVQDRAKRIRVDEIREVRNDIMQFDPYFEPTAAVPILCNFLKVLGSRVP